MVKIYTKEQKNEYMKNYYRKKVGDNFGKSKFSIKYTDEETKFIKDNYKNMSDKNIGKVLGRTGDAIQKKMKYLNLKRTKEEIRNNFLKAVENKELGKPKKYKINSHKWRKFITISKNNRILESHYVWCSQPGNLPYIPTGFVIHHYDCNPDNNSPNNLVMLPSTDHRKIHCQISRIIRSKL